MKKCNICHRELPEESFNKNKRMLDGLEPTCRNCRSIKSRELRARHYFKSYAVTKRSECKRKGIPFDLDAEYLESIWTGICPVFGTPISKASEGRGSMHSAHLDRIDPNGGYVYGNVAWISGRANRIKYDATIEELSAIISYMKRVTTIPKGSTLK